ncbi:uncharacterized protein [Nicotiana sylvestris]|uniref:uncharacterized protein n=1 Tax=Nicotiana sylvestris TaxID=4096 RepID=UPI00388CC099
MIVDAFSRKAESMGSLAFIPDEERPLATDIQALANRFVRLDIPEPSRSLACVVAQLYLLECIKARQFYDPYLLVLKDIVQQGGLKKVMIGDDGVMRLQGRICVSNVDGLRELILENAHSSQYSIHPCVTKMYHNLKQYYWWQKMKKDIVRLVGTNSTSASIRTKSDFVAMERLLEQGRSTLLTSSKRS